MKFIIYLQKLEAIKHFAKQKSTGTPRTLARRLEVSERTLLRMVQQLREQGYEINYNRARDCYEMGSS